MILQDQGHPDDSASKKSSVSLSWELGTIKDCSGSASLKLGKSHIVCSINGPRAVQRGISAVSIHADISINTFSERCILLCDVKLASHVKRQDCDNVNNNSQLIDKNLSTLLRHSLEPSVLLDAYPKSVITVDVLIMETSDQDLAAIINCATLALVHSGIEMKDLVTAVTSNMYTDSIKFHESESKCGLTLACLPNLEEISQLIWSGNVQNNSVYLQTIKKAMKQCKHTRKLMEDYLIKYYEALNKE